MNGVLVDVDSLELYYAAVCAGARGADGDWLELVAGGADQIGLLGVGLGQPIPAELFSTVPLRIQVRAELLEAPPDA